MPSALETSTEALVSKLSDRLQQAAFLNSSLPSTSTVCTPRRDMPLWPPSVRMIRASVLRMRKSKSGSVSAAASTKRVSGIRSRQDAVMRRGKVGLESTKRPLASVLAMSFPPMSRTAAFSTGICCLPSNCRTLPVTWALMAAGSRKSIARISDRRISLRGICNIPESTHRRCRVLCLLRYHGLRSESGYAVELH